MFYSEVHLIMNIYVVRGPFGPVDTAECFKSRSTDLGPTLHFVCSQPTTPTYLSIMNRHHQPWPTMSPNSGTLPGASGSSKGGRAVTECDHHDPNKLSPIIIEFLLRLVYHSQILTNLRWNIPRIAVVAGSPKSNSDLERTIDELQWLTKIVGDLFSQFHQSVEHQTLPAVQSLRIPQQPPFQLCAPSHYPQTMPVTENLTRHY
jgi:hypothetical protein